MAITLHWRRLLSLAVNKVNFHKHSGKETEFSWRGREWWRSNSLLLPVVRLSMGHRKPRSLKKWNPKEHLVRWWVSHQILGKTKIIPSNDILIYKLSCFTKVCCRVAVVSGRAMEACGLSFLESLGTRSLAFGQSAYRVLGSHRRAALAQTTFPGSLAPPHSIFLQLFKSFC